MIDTSSTSSENSRAACAANVQRFKWFAFAASFHASLPVFFLFFSQFVSLEQALTLGAVYYLSVCFWEVPSGYFSDRIGRRLTLILAAVAFAAAFIVFGIAFGQNHSFASLALGQALFALSMALVSGTDSAFLYDSLRAINETERYAEVQAQQEKYSYTALTTACLLGGALGTMNLSWPYMLSLLGALWMLWLAYNFTEPPPTENEQAQSLLSNIRHCLAHLKNPLLAWLFAVMVLIYGLEHIPYEYYQAYIKLLNLSWLSGSDDGSPMVSGVVIAISMFGGILGAALSIKLEQRLGLKLLLLLAFALQLLIIGSLALTLNVLVLAVLMMRNFAMAMVHAPALACIQPQLQSHLRATYLSIQSLTARLLLSGGLLALASSLPEGQNLDWPALSGVLRLALITGVAGAALIMLCTPKQLTQRAEQPEP